MKGGCKLKKIAWRLSALKLRGRKHSSYRKPPKKLLKSEGHVILKPKFQLGAFCKKGFWGPSKWILRPLIALHGQNVTCWASNPCLLFNPRVEVTWVINISIYDSLTTERMKNHRWYTSIRLFKKAITVSDEYQINLRFFSRTKCLMHYGYEWSYRSKNRIVFLYPNNNFICSNISWFSTIDNPFRIIITQWS